MVQVKICGLKTPEAVEAAIKNGADYIGLVHFSKSPRHVNLQEAADLARRARGRARIVLLLVNPELSLVDEVVKTVAPDYIQLHGDESVEKVQAIGKRADLPIIKAIKVESPRDVRQAAAYQDVVDLVLFDAKPPKNSKLPGGNGIPFDWSVLRGFNTKDKYMLSGGLDPQSVATAIKISNAPIVDVSSGVETSPGIKDLQKIRQFMEQAHK
jgi:phosphoribosylanthranilate isomerase